MKPVDEWIALGDELGPEAAKVLTPEKCRWLTTPDPIDVNDWNVAHRFKGQITDKVFDLALVRVMKAQLKGVGLGYYTQYAIHHARPRHYIIAVCLENENEK